jgi:hypothetical protein
MLGLFSTPFESLVEVILRTEVVQYSKGMARPVRFMPSKVVTHQIAWQADGIKPHGSSKRHTVTHYKQHSMKLLL